LAGLAFHCYGGMDGYTQLHEEFPTVPLIESECSPGITPYSVDETVIDAARNWAQGTQLWNLALDPSHGPVEQPNTGCPGCSGIITIDQHKRTASYGSNYYELGQISKFVMPGAVRVYSDRLVHDWNNGYAANKHGVTAGVDNVVFQNPNGAFVMVAFNSATRPKTFAVSYNGRAFPYTLGAGSTVTFIWR
jgi:glucosylceramidase